MYVCVSMFSVHVSHHTKHTPMFPPTSNRNCFCFRWVLRVPRLSWEKNTFCVKQEAHTTALPIKLQNASIWWQHLHGNHYGVSTLLTRSRSQSAPWHPVPLSCCPVVSPWKPWRAGEHGPWWLHRGGQWAANKGHISSQCQTACIQTHTNNFCVLIYDCIYMHINLHSLLWKKNAGY